MSDDNDLIRRRDALKAVDGAYDDSLEPDLADAATRIAALPAAPTFTAADLERAYKKGLTDALGVIASLGYGKSEDVDEGHEQAFRAIEKHLSEWGSADLAQRVKE